MTTRPSDAPEVVVVGNAGVDTNVYLPGDAIDWTREANFSDNRDYAGQAGGYAARGYAQAGRATAFVGALGDDAAGTMVREAFGRDGIDARGVPRSGRHRPQRQHHVCRSRRPGSAQEFL